MNMKSKVKTIIVAIAMAISGVGTAVANDSVNVNSNIYLSSGSEFNFKAYMNKKAKKFIKKNNEDWATFNTVVRLYNNAPGKFMNLTTEEQEDFMIAVNSINGKLERMNNREAQIWLKKVDVTDKVFNFLWSNKTDTRTFEELYELPIIQLEATVGR
jgi:hypothetical protein